MSVSFSVGYAGRLDQLKRILAVSASVRNVYTGGLSRRIAGGRPQYIESMEALREQVDFAHGRNVTFDVALNAPVHVPAMQDRAWWGDTIQYLRDLEELRVDGVIVSHPFLIEATRANTRLKISVSTINETMTTRAALYYEAMGADIIVPSMNLNMNRAELKRMSRALKRARILIMLNERCLGDCPWRRFHFDWNAGKTTSIGYEADPYFTNCTKLMYEQPYLLLANNTIRPEDVRHYEEITSDFKVLGRDATIEDVELRLKAYTEGRFDGNFVRLVHSGLAPALDIPNRALDGLIEKKWDCSKICRDCGHCIRLAESVVTRR